MQIIFARTLSVEVLHVDVWRKVSTNTQTIPTVHDQLTNLHVCMSVHIAIHESDLERVSR